MNTVNLILFMIIGSFAFSQTDSLSLTERSKLEFGGYIKDMQIFSFDGHGELINDNLIHNRIRFKYFAGEQLTFDLEIRTRLFTGESVELNPNFSELVSQDNGIVDLSWAIVDKNALVLLSQIDRAYVDFSINEWEIRAGRQRINWGVNLYWNPNDLFNAYNLVDFDYEERPGSDALRIQRFFKNTSSMEFVIQPSKNSNDWTVASMYKFNKWAYDFQILASWWKKDIVIGGGWAGAIKNTGFKGEMSWFIPRDGSTSSLSSSVSFDYIFANQMFVSGGFLFNSSGISQSLDSELNLFNGELSAKNLLPMKYSALLSWSTPINPILSASMVVIYSPGVNTSFIMPSMGFSIANNWELALFAQSFWLDTDGFNNIANGIYLRLKGSY